ncbi:MAG: polyribonucleotide nucleotidyltransferase [Candidatus Caenarcaniphilales bacterium]|nr:polyribonucleotide nucleotidyltransferase [Candidatus Caenarcaniphilales bacterium]
MFAYPEDAKSTSLKINPEFTVKLETGVLANEADASVVLTCEDTIILVTCCVSKAPRENIDFFPLMVDFEERLYAVGRIPGSYNRREGRPNDKAILASRLIDRPIRPLFPDGFFNDVHIVATVLSSDQKHPTDLLAMFGASAAITLAGLPFKGPIGAVRVGLVKGQFIANPTYEQLQASQLDLVVAGNEKNILMVEAGADFVKEEVILAGIAFAQDSIKEQIKIQKDFAASLGIEKRSYEPPSPLEETLQKLVNDLCEPKLLESLNSHIKDKGGREKLVDEALALLKGHFEALAIDDPERIKLPEALKLAKKLEKKLMRDQVMQKGERVDGRRCNEIRPIWAKVGALPRAHGSGIFTRGSTQVVSVVTLGTGLDTKPIDGIWLERELAYYHAYNFPGFSVGEAKPSRSPGRREIGHGALAERALIPTLPPKELFPYVIRVVSDVLSSNGSTSMASTCGSTLALMDAGVPIKEPIGGIAMGLILEGDQCAILSDIQGVEDFLGDMDFKVTGGMDGVTAIQLDLKLPLGISLPMLKVALDQALVGRQHIITKMLEAIEKPRENISQYAPQVVTLQIEQGDIGGVIGSGGKNIKKLIEETGVDKIDIADDGTVTIAGKGEAPLVCRERIIAQTMKFEPGQEYKGVIVRQVQSGLLVEFAPGKAGLIRPPRPNDHPGRHRRHNGRATQDIPDFNLNDFVIGEEVFGLVRDVDMKGKIYLDSIRKI